MMEEEGKCRAEAEARGLPEAPGGRITEKKLGKIRRGATVNVIYYGHK